MLANLHKINLTFIEKAPVTQPNIYRLDSLEWDIDEDAKFEISGPNGL